MSEVNGPWIEIWELCEVCNGTGRNPKADSACPKCGQAEGERKGKVKKMITFPEFHDIMHRA